MNKIPPAFHLQFDDHFMLTVFITMLNRVMLKQWQTVAKNFLPIVAKLSKDSKIDSETADFAL